MSERVADQKRSLEQLHISAVVSPLGVNGGTAIWKTQGWLSRSLVSIYRRFPLGHLRRGGGGGGGTILSNLELKNYSLLEKGVGTSG